MGPVAVLAGVWLFSKFLGNDDQAGDAPAPSSPGGARPPVLPAGVLDMVTPDDGGVPVPTGRGSGRGDALGGGRGAGGGGALVTPDVNGTPGATPVVGDGVTANGVLKASALPQTSRGALPSSLAAFVAPRG